MGLIGEIFALAGLHIDNSSFNQYSTALKSAEGGVDKFQNTTKAALAGAFTLPAAAIGSIVSYGAQVASGFEDASTTLTTLYGNLDVAKEKFTWLSDFAASTPFEFPELLDATVKLKSYGIEAEDYMGTIGDASAAMGKSLDQTTEAVADAMTGEFERLKEYGIKAVVITKSNYQQMGLEMSQVGQTALSYTNQAGEQQYKVVDRTNRQMVLSSIQSIWDVEKGFKGAMELRSQTMSGLLSTLKDNLSMGLADMLGFNLKTMEVQSASLLGVFKVLLAGVVKLTGGFKDLSEPVQTLIVVAAVAVAGLGLLAAGMIAYTAASSLAITPTLTLAAGINAAIWPVTAIVGGLALLAAGLVYLDEKTGLVSTTFQFLGDVFTIVWNGLKIAAGEAIDWISDKINGFIDLMSGLSSALGLDTLSDAILGPLSVLSEGLGGIVTKVHELAEGYRKEGEEIGTAADTAAGSVEDAGATAEEAHDSWLDSAKDLATGSKDAYGDVTGAADQAKSEFDKTFAGIQTDLQAKQQAQIQFSVGIDTADLQKGVQLIDGSLVGINAKGELVHRTLDGTDEVLTQMGTHHFETTNGGLDVMVGNAGNMGKMMDEANKSAEGMDNKVVVLNTDIKNLDSTQLVGLNGQVVTLGQNTGDADSKVNLLTAGYNGLNGQNLGGLNGQINTAKTNTDTANTSTGNWRAGIGAVNAAPMNTLVGNLNTANSQITTDNTSTTTWKGTLGQTNAAPFGSLFGNLITGNTHLNQNNTSTGTWNSALGRTNASPFATLHGNLGIANTKVGNVNSTTLTANQNVGKLGSMSFSTTISGLGSIVTKLENGVIAKAKEALTWLSKLGGSSGSSGSGGSNKSAQNTTISNNSSIVKTYNISTSGTSGLINTLQRLS